MSAASSGPASLWGWLRGTAYPLTKLGTALILVASVVLLVRGPALSSGNRAAAEGVGGKDTDLPTTPHAGGSAYVLASLLRYFLFPVASSPLLLAWLYAACFAVCSSYLERVWSVQEYASFLGGSYAVLLAYHTLWLGILSLGRGAGLLLTPSSLNGAGMGAGLDGVLAGFSVAFKLLIPEHHVKVGGLMFFRVKQIPSLIICFYAVLFLLGIECRRLGIVFCGILQSWVYLRFIHRHAGVVGPGAPNASTVLLRGHISEEFGVLSFFPDALHPALDPLFTAVYARVNTLVRAHGWALGTSTAEQASLLRNLEAGTPKAPAPTSLKDALGENPAADADRRRALALKALEVRLEAKENAVR